MGTPYVGEIRMFGGNFAPAGWMLCQGQIIPISQNDVLFNLIGTTYGGDGQSTFALPDLQGRVPVHMGTGSGLSTYNLGDKAGTESVTLNTQQIPNHNHLLMATNTGQQLAPTNGVPATATSTQTNAWAYGPTTNTPVVLAAGSISNTGGNQPHDNMAPFLCINFIISMFGVFPSPT